MFFFILAVNFNSRIFHAIDDVIINSRHDSRLLIKHLLIVGAIAIKLLSVSDPFLWLSIFGVADGGRKKCSIDLLLRRVMILIRRAWWKVLATQSRNCFLIGKVNEVRRAIALHGNDKAFFGGKKPLSYCRHENTFLRFIIGQNVKFSSSRAQLELDRQEGESLAKSRGMFVVCVFRFIINRKDWKVVAA